MPTPTLSLQARALRLLATREHSRAELARKLARFSDDEAEIARVIDTLADKNLQSDARYAASVVHRQAERFGRGRVARALREQGVDEAQTQAALAGLTREQQEAQLQALWRRRFTPPRNASERARQGRFLLGRGFEASLVYAWMRQVSRMSPEQDITEPDEGEDSGTA